MKYMNKSNRVDMDDVISKKTVHADKKLVRYTMGVLLSFAALNAFGGGYYGMAGAEGVPVEWLEGSPFRSYLIPGLILFVVVGGAFLTAAIMAFARSRHARNAAFLAVAVVFVWLAVQVSIIGYVSWMQPVTATVALLILLLALKLPRTA